MLGQVDYPVLMELNYRDRCSLVLWHGRYYAMTLAEGSFNAGLASSGGYWHLHQASRLPLLKVLIDADVRPAVSSPIVASQPSAKKSEPQLVEEGYRDHNIIFWNDRFYALAQSEGAFDPQRMEAGTHPNCLDARTVAELKLLVDARPMPVAPRRLAFRVLRKCVRLARRARNSMQSPPPAPPRAVLIEEGVNGANIVRFGDWFYAVPQASCAVVLAQNDPSLMRNLPRAQ